MPINKQSYQIQGMRQDNLVGTGYSNKFAHEIMNMRINTIGDYTTASWTTEKSTKEVIIEGIKDWFDTLDDFKNLQPIGQANINDTWVLFCKGNKDYIITLKYKNNGNLNLTVLFEGNLNFNIKHPIETLVFYENENIQKVYWVDGINQARVINIAQQYVNDINTQFDFVQEVSLNEEVEINKLQLGQGLFPPCSVQYAITYYQKYGAETNIVYISPQYYPTLGDRACSPDELSGDSFEIIVNNLDNEHNFDFIRLYSIIRTSDGATPIVRIVEDINIKNLTSVTFVDNNGKGRIIDPTIINYIGGYDIIPYTINQKDNTLFLGNIKLNTDSITSVGLSIDSEDIKFDNTENIKLIPFRKTFKYRKKSSIDIPSSVTPLNYNIYNYHNEMNPATILLSENETQNYYGNSYEFKVFKKGECYRFGLQAQNIYGVWSEVLYLKDLVYDKLPDNPTDKDYYKVGYAKFSLTSENAKKLLDKHYKKVRLVCCYPSIAERKVLAQGIISPTIYNIQERSEHTPDCMASWFFRPRNISLVKEIQSYNIGNPESSNYDNNASVYKITSNVLTLNSPDIELDESIRTLDLNQSSVNHIGRATLNGFTNAIYLDAGKPATDSIGITNVGLTNKIIQGELTNLSSEYHHITPFKWNDCDVYATWPTYAPAQYDIYPFHRKTSLNNYVKDANPWPVYTDVIYGYVDKEHSVSLSAALHSKAMSYFAFSNATTFDNTTNTLSTTGDIPQWFDSLEESLIKLDGIIYYGNRNTLARCIQLPTYNNYTNLEKYKEDIKKYTTTYTNNITSTEYSFTTIGSYMIEGKGSIDNTYDATLLFYTATSDPVSITYKSTPHLVFKGSNSPMPSSEVIGSQNLSIGELVRDNVKRNNVSQTDIYLPCGPAVKLEYDNEEHTEAKSCEVYGLEGDSYLMRYDCLKTYAYTPEDLNQVIDIASIMCETRINLDGRYDRNRGLSDNTSVSPKNFNLINKSYTQQNNLFSYTTLDPADTILSNLNNQFTWTNTKVSGEDIDAWTNITMASVADANGTLGAITKIINLNDKLYLFQEHGVAQIGFNENTAISTESGVPLELAKTGKYTGLNYLTTEIGCQNKWSISTTKNGIFFIDDSRQELLTLSEGFTSLSGVHGFDAFMIKQLPAVFEAWNPVDFNNFITYYDKLSNDIYYINKNVCIAWNEQTNSFTSFYNYEHTPYMMNLGQHSVMWHNGVYAARENDTYSEFFGNIKDYWMTIVCDGLTHEGSAFPADKVFNNVEYRADIYNLDGSNTNYSVSIFNKKQAWNGYQNSNECSLDGIRKFNTWRIQLPRHAGTRDRIRSPFCYIKLKQDQSIKQQIDRAILHDLAVYFDMK